MRFKLIACKVIYREISLLSATSQSIIDVTYLRQGYHNTPKLLNELLQKEIDRIDTSDDIYSFIPYDDEDFDAILLGYGLCSNAIAGLSSKKYPIVVPRAHDCATLLLGSKERYKQIFETHNGGVYWYTAGWNENTPMPSAKRIEKLRNTYINLYGEENADYLMEMEQQWLREYQWCTFIDWESLPNQVHIKYTKECADHLNWQYEQLSGDDSLLKELISGHWLPDKFLVVPPGKKIIQTYGEDIISWE